MTCTSNHFLAFLAVVFGFEVVVHSAHAHVAREHDLVGMRSAYRGISMSGHLGHSL
jgi:hypothetical protein